MASLKSVFHAGAAGPISHVSASAALTGYEPLVESIDSM
jgi:hypothetical protein